MIPMNTRMFRPVLVLVAALGLSACAQTIDDTVFPEPASRAAPVDSSLTAPVGSLPVALPDFSVVQVNVSVPDTLRVSEANRYLPAGDIVWREDPMGDRHEQVRVIIQDALQQGTEDFTGSRQVAMDVVVHRFHALSEKARYSVGGVHNIEFSLRLRDVTTGEILGEPKMIDASFDALGGNAAVQAEGRGITQKVRITQHLKYVIQQELGSANGYVAQDTGIIGAMNRI